ncbi:uncharacterized protein [Arachis hypogaea]|uniref:uncharacterized protein isoform X1 n=1 Tax=Arachis hypogaea TaxID=3818 RepID=UPI0010FC48D7|nr:uncharacterized protein LOC112723293 isoform X1 [Arachis hypogaea]
MPRPGPRPYECVRRAWHSERHQPVRGSIIQQIFRVVNEAHTPATKKNKEWQEKLPVVVLKAEEIMYSKANSEAEYLNPDTLWERLNDAINTIIRRDETTETGDLLPPCVEAALNLGCKPVRTSRSDRHNNPRTYLSPRTQHPPPPPPPHPPSGPPRPVGENPYARVSSSGVSQIPVSDSRIHAQQNTRMMGSPNYPFSESFPSGHHQHLAMETKPPSNFGSVYPLYYGYEAKEPQLRTTTVDNSGPETIFVGRPVITPVPEPSGIGLLENFPYGRYPHLPNRAGKETVVGMPEGLRDTECDLSLRLGRCFHPCSSSKNCSAYETEDAGLGAPQGGTKFSHLSLQRNKEFCFYPRETSYGTIGPSSARCNGEREYQNLEATLRKRKAPIGNNEEDGQFCRHLGVPSNQFTGRMQGPETLWMCSSACEKF